MFHQKAKITVRSIFTLFLLLAFTLGLLFSLSHHCMEEDCPLCLLKEENGEGLCLPLLRTLLLPPAEKKGSCSPQGSPVPRLQEDSLVRQKVKLSD